LNLLFVVVSIPENEEIENMFKDGKFVQDVYDKDSNLLGVFISQELWREVGPEVQPLLDRHLGPETPSTVQQPEPVQDWELLKAHWDFKYPVDMDVHCSVCGSQTENWQEDEPRKFVLKAASLGGLVAFTCLQCGARVTKRHFKDHINVTAQPAKTQG
jgi:hypothetical protein